MIFFPKQLVMLGFLYDHPNCSIAGIVFKHDIMYSHAIKFIKLMNDRRVLNIEKIGRRNVINLTVKGRELSRVVKNYLELAEKI